MATRKPGSSQPSTNKRTAHSPRSISRRTGKTIKAAVDDFLLDRQSQNHSPQTLQWHTIALDHFVTFLEQEHQVTMADLCGGRRLERENSIKENECHAKRAKNEHQRD